MILRVVFAAVLVATPLLAVPPASALSCVMPTATTLVAEAPAAIVGRVLAADVDGGRLTLAVDEVLKGGPFQKRLELPGTALGWDDWTSEQMRAGPVLFSLHEQEDGTLATGACSYVLDRQIIAEARTLAEDAGTTSEPRAGATSNPAAASAESSNRPLVIVGAAASVALLAVGAALVRSRRLRRPASGT